MKVKVKVNTQLGSERTERAEENNKKRAENYDIINE